MSVIFLHVMLYDQSSRIFSDTGVYSADKGGMIMFSVVISGIHIAFFSVFMDMIIGELGSQINFNFIHGAGYEIAQFFIKFVYFLQFFKCYMGKQWTVTIYLKR